MQLLMRTQNICCDNCTFCQTRDLRNGKGSLDVARLSHIISDFLTTNIPGIRFDGLGEPAIIPEFYSILERIFEKGKYISIISNGTSIPIYAQNLACVSSFIRISFDAATEKTHQKIHRSALSDTFTKRVQNFQKNCRVRDEKNPSCLIGGHFVITTENYHEIIPFAKLMHESGADFVDYCLLKTNSMNIASTIKGIADQVEDAIGEVRSGLGKKIACIYRDDREEKRYADQMKQSHVKEDGICWHGLCMPAVNWRGQIIGCGKYEEQVRTDSASTLGNMLADQFSVIWEKNSKIMRTFRSRYCSTYGPCYFSYFNFAMSWVIEQIRKNESVTFFCSTSEGDII